MRRLVAIVLAAGLLAVVGAGRADAAPPGPPLGSLPTLSGHLPLVGDWNGDGVDSFGIFVDGLFIVSNNAVSPGSGRDAQALFGNADWLPLVGDWNGDGRDTIGTWSGGAFYLSNTVSTTAVADQVAIFGSPDDLPIVGDWNGDGRDTVGVYRDGVFLLSNSASGPSPTDVVAPYGSPGDIALVGDWDGDGSDGIGVRRGLTFYLLNQVRGSNAADIVLPYGDPGDPALVGDFDGVGPDGVGVRKGSGNFLRDGLAGAGPAFERVVLYGNPTTVTAPREPNLQITTVMSGLSNPWDVVQAPDGTLLVTERAGRLRVRLGDGTVRTLAADFSDLFVASETGLLGLEIDPAFASNRRIYTCQGAPGPSVKVVAWTVDAAWTRVDRATDPLVGGISASSGRHGGCRLRIAPDGSLWIGTGDAAVGTNPQNLNSLAGKVLRVNRLTGAAAPGNPALGGDPRIVSYGHRNVQGLAVRPIYNDVWVTEHGPDRDDEVNQVVIGGNYGWNPVPGYNEAVPMTDRGAFPAAVPARWSSGVPTLAVSGADFLRGRAWNTWQGGLAVATLKNSTLRVLFFDSDGRLITTRTPAALNGTYGRLRSARLGLDGRLYVTTDNGGGTDTVLRVTPT